MKHNPWGLTPTEYAILLQTIQGTTTNDGLAEHFSVSYRTIQTHWQNIFDKMHPPDRNKLAVVLQFLSE